MSIKLIRGYDTLPQLPYGWDHPQEVIDDCARRQQARIDELKMAHDCREDSDRGWRDIYTLGICYGWSPAGTELDGDPNWDGTYFSNSFKYGARVEDEDARALADALKRALCEEDAEHEFEHRLLRLGLAVSSAWGGNVDDADAALMLLEYPDGRRAVENHVKFLERGAFTIH